MIGIERVHLLARPVRLHPSLKRNRDGAIPQALDINARHATEFSALSCNGVTSGTVASGCTHRRAGATSSSEHCP